MTVTEKFRAFRIHEADKGVRAGFETLVLDDLTPGDVVIRVEYSSINYKDALAATGAGRILRRFPLNGGIDAAGTVVESADSRYKSGDPVLITGCGLGETVDGGFCEYVRAEGDWVIPIPEGLDARQAMMLGTAGFTAALAIHKMEHNGQSPDKGAIVVTGATGGVGSIAIDMLSGRGYDVAAVTGKIDEVGYLTSLGATEVRDRTKVDLGKRPMEKAEFAGAIDNLGGETLTWLTRTVGWWGNIASIGLASSIKLDTTVMPFILRGISLLGINSMATPRDLRLAVWNRIASDLKPRHLEQIASREIAFDDLPGEFDGYLSARVRGRTVVRIRS